MGNPFSMEFRNLPRTLPPVGSSPFGSQSNIPLPGSSPFGSQRNLPAAGSSPISSTITPNPQTVSNRSLPPGFRSDTLVVPQVIPPVIPATVAATGTQDLKRKLAQPQISTIDPFLLDALTRQLNLVDEERGLSPAATSALRTDLSQELSNRGRVAQEELNTRLLRTGAIDPSGQLPGGFAQIAGGDRLLREQFESSRAGLERDVILADEDRRFESLLANRQTASTALGFGLQASSQAGLQAGEFGEAQKQRDFAADQASLQRAFSGTQSDIDRTFQENQAAINREFGSEQAFLDRNLARQENALDRSIERFRTEQEFPGFGDVLLSAVGGAATAAAIDLVKGAIKGKILNSDEVRKITEGATIGTFGTKIAAFITDNPLFFGIGAAILAGTIWLKSQAKWEANEMVRQFQNPFAEEFLIPFVQALHDAGQTTNRLPLSKALIARNELVNAMNEYEKKVNKWAKGSSDKELVAGQSVNTLRNQPNIGTNIILQDLTNYIISRQGQVNRGEVSD